MECTISTEQSQVEKIQPLRSGFLSLEEAGGASYSKRIALTLDRARSSQFQRLISWFERNDFHKEATALRSCGGFFKHGFDKKGHRFFKQIFCGREWCPHCGRAEKKESDERAPVHRRRYSRLWDRLMWSDKLGYLVLTIPEELRQSFKDRDNLSALYRIGWEVVRDVLNVDGCLCVVHLFGDRDNNFKPHVNIIFPTSSKLIVKKKLQKIKNEWAIRIEKLLGVSWPRDDKGQLKLNANYRYRDTIGKKAHTLKYIARPVCGFERFMKLDDGLRTFLLSLSGNRNFRWYGELSNCKYKEYLKLRGVTDSPAMPNKQDEIYRQLCNKVCPMCLEKLQYEAGLIYFADLPYRDDMKEIATGYFVAGATQEDFETLKRSLRSP